MWIQEGTLQRILATCSRSVDDYPIQCELRYQTVLNHISISRIETVPMPYRASPCERRSCHPEQGAHARCNAWADMRVL